MKYLREIALSIVVMFALIFTVGLIVFGVSSLFTEFFGGEALTLGSSIVVGGILCAFIGTVWYMKGKENV
jgi:uncharacterized membrane protein (DUF485 family)